MSAGLLNYHRKLVTDPVRMRAWSRAIQQVVKPGDVVVDLGAGTGVLSLMACAAGAGRVYAIEEASIIEVAREAARQNGCVGRIRFLAESSFDVRLPEPADVLLSDVYGSFGFNGNMLGALIDGRTRFLKPGGALLPLGAEPCCVPVELPGFYVKTIDAWGPDLCGFDYRATRKRAVNQMHLCELPADAALAEPAWLGGVDVTRAQSAAWKGSAEFAISRPGTLHGIGGWCRADWSAGIAETNSPFASPRLDWTQALFPVETPVSVRPGDAVTASFELATHGSWMIWTWGVSVSSTNAKSRRFRHSTFQGEFLSLEDWRRRQPDYVPRASAQAEIIPTVVSLCDGTRSRRQIEDEVARRFPPPLEDPIKIQRLTSKILRLLAE